MNEKIVTCDLSAIENRGLGYLARCDKITDVFRKGRDPYVDFDARLRKIAYETAWAEFKGGNKKPRTDAKPAVLGAGYGLGGGEEVITPQGDKIRGGLWGYAKGMGVDITREFAHESVRVFRETYQEVPVFWTDMEEGFKHVLKHGGTIVVGDVTYNKREREWGKAEKVYENPYIEFSRKSLRGHGPAILMRLPSGRCLHYLNARIETEPFTFTDKRTGEKKTLDGEVIYYEGIEHSNSTDANGQRAKKRAVWGRVKTYGGKLCLAGDTLVITDKGLCRLDEMAIDKKVWDGIQWIRHNGLICNGEKDTNTWMGLTGTPDHQILAGREWHELGKTTSLNGLCSLLTGLASAVQLWCSLSLEKGVLGSGVIVDKYSTLIRGHYGEIKSMLVLLAAAKQVIKTASTDLGTTSYWIQNYDKCGFVNYLESSLVATTQNAPHITITGEEEFLFTNLGDGAAVFGCNTPSLFLAGMTQLLNLIESITTAIMNRGISDLFLEKRIQTIAELLSLLLGLEKSCLTQSFIGDTLRSGVKTLYTIISNGVAPLSGVSKDTSKQKVYDLSDCGPRHRFTILTPAGPVIVHNCENAVQAFSRDLLLNGMFLAKDLGFSIRGMFHDELMTIVPNDPFGVGLPDLRWCMSEPPSWCPDILLGAEGWEGFFYKKA